MINKQYSIKEAADFLSVSIATLRRWDSSGKLKSVRKNSSKHRRYSPASLEEFLIANCVSVAEKWVKNNIGLKPNDIFYCPNSSIFQGRLYKLRIALSREEEIESIYSLLLLVVGEIGDNSFAHNLGNWPDINGIFFGYDVKKKVVVLADRGQGILKTLKRVRPELKNAPDALEVAFTEVVSGRAPESRGNGLKTVKAVIENNPISLFFQSGNAKIKLEKNNGALKIKKAKDSFRGCLAIIKF